MALGRVSLSRAERQTLARVLCGLNGVSVVTGAVLVLMGVYLWAELRRWQEVMSEEVLSAVPAVLVWTGLWACAVNLLGARLCLDCTDLNRFLRWKLVLAPYFLVSLLLTAGVLLAAALCYGLSLSGRLDAALEAGLHSAMRRYKDADQLKTSLDLLQIQLNCCGKDRYQDWFRVQWVSDQYLDRTDPRVRERIRSNVWGQYLLDSVPFSCCDPASPWPCLQSHLTSRPAHFLFHDQIRSVGLWRQGCRVALGEHYSSIMNCISLTALGVWVFELLVVTGVRYLQTSMENVLRLGDPESNSDAWILENSLTETARNNFNIIKSLGKCYHGNEDDDDPNIDHNPLPERPGPERPGPEQTKSI